MGRVADSAGIQFRVLNASKGPAVRGPRAQMDRALYRREMHEILRSQRNLAIRAGAVEDVWISTKGLLAGIVLESGEKIAASRVIVTTGTFLRGLIHIGGRTISAGRLGEKPSSGLSQTLADHGFKLGRLKTGTPPRLHRRSIDYTSLQPQYGDTPPQQFSFIGSRPRVNQIACHITGTTNEKHELIRAILHQSPMYGGANASQGPR